MFWAWCGAQVTPRVSQDLSEGSETLLRFYLSTYPDSAAAFQSVSGFANLNSIIGALAYLNGLA